MAMVKLRENLAMKELAAELRGHRLTDFIDRRLALGWPLPIDDFTFFYEK